MWSNSAVCFCGVHNVPLLHRDSGQTQTSSPAALWGVRGFHVTAHCVVVWGGLVRMGPAYWTVSSPEKDGGEPCGRSRRSAVVECHRTEQKQAGTLNCSLTTLKPTSTLCYYILLSIITWLIVWVLHSFSCQIVTIAVQSCQKNHESPPISRCWQAFIETQVCLPTEILFSKFPGENSESKQITQTYSK